MCRRYQLFGVGTIAMGVGFLLSALICSISLSVIIGIILVVTGCVLTKKF